MSSRILRRDIEKRNAAIAARKEDVKEKQLCLFVKVNGSYTPAGRPGFSWVQVITPEGDSPVFKVFNSKVTPRSELKVWVGKGLSGRVEVLDFYNGEIPDIPGYNGQNYQKIYTPDLEWPDFNPGPNAVSIYPRAPVYLRTYPGEAGGLTISVAPLRYIYGNDLVLFSGLQNHSISASQPASGLARFVLIYLDLATNAIGTTNGTTATDTGTTLPPFPTFPDGAIPSALVRIDGDQTTISEGDVLDVRPHLGEAATGAINAPADAQYLTLAADDGLTVERVLNLNSSHFDVTDNGAGGNYDVDHAVISVGDLHPIYPRRTLLTFKGSIFVASGPGTVTEIPSSLTDGDVLTVNTALDTGVGWSAGNTSGAQGVRESFIDGVLATATDVGPTHIMHGAGEISAVYIHCKKPGSAGTTIIDINKQSPGGSPTTIFTTQSNRPQLAYDDADQIAQAAAVEVTTVAALDLLTVDIDAAATGAADLTVLIVIGKAAAVLPVSAAPNLGLIEAQYLGQWLDNDYETYGGPSGATSAAQLSFFGA